MTDEQVLDRLQMLRQIIARRDTTVFSTRGRPYLLSLIAALDSAADAVDERRAKHETLGL